MTITALTASRAGKNGPRPVNLRADLRAIANLMEICFADEMDAGGRAAIREMRFLSHIGPLLWLLSGLNRVVKGLAGGFVWVEDGHLVGNISMYRTETADPGWVIANVAVHPDQRRRGIARRLMHTCLEQLREYGARSVDLQVKYDNTGAIALYRQLGFYPVETWATWRRSPSAAPRVVDHVERDLPIRRARGADWRAIYGLARLTRPYGLGWMRPFTAQTFRRGFLQTLGDLLIGRAYEYFLVPTPGDGTAQTLAAALVMRLSTNYTSDRLTLLVHPERRGEVEAPLLAFALRRLRGRDRSVVIEHPYDVLSGATMALDALHFERRQTLIQMRYDWA